MKKMFAPLLLLLLLLCGCGKAPEPEEPEENDIFYSDATAIDFLEGCWTNGRGEYMIAGRGGGPLIVWDTNLPIVTCDLYVLERGVLKGGSADGEVRELLRFEKVDEDSIRVESLLTGESSLFLRDSLQVDGQRLDNEYVFWSMARAAQYLRGMWMDEDGGYFVLEVGEDGAVSWNSDLEMPPCDYIDFYDGALCAVTRAGSGGKTVTPAYTFDILGPDLVTATSAADGSVRRFERLSRELEPELLNSRYVFANPQRAFVFLEGLWKDGGGNFFSVENSGGNIRWNTNLSIPRHASYTFAGGALVGVDSEEDGSRVQTEIFCFTILSQDRVEIRVPGTDNVYTLERQP